MDHRIVGTTLPALEVDLQDGESIIAESGELSWMTASITMKTSTQGGGAKGVFGMIKRAAGGGTLFMTEYTAQGSPGSVTFATKLPGHIVPVAVEAGQTFMIHRHGFLAGTTGIEIAAGFQRKLGAGIFGGEGFVLQRLAGTGHAWIGLSGEVVTKDLGPGEVLRAHPGNIGMFDANVTFDVQMMKGISNAIFGGEGLFLAILTGPGRVWLQTLPIANLAHALIPYLPSNKGS